MKTRVMIEIGMPGPASGPPPAPSLSVEDQVRDALECIESGYKSDVEWTMVNKLYRALKAKPKLSPRAENLMKMIEPVLAKFGYHKTTTEGA